MIIYEVNLTIDREIFSEYFKWLLPHVEAMLQFRGFRQAEISEEKQELEDKKKLTVRYTLDSEEDLNDYLQDHAPSMRDASKKFGSQLSASRRILRILSCKLSSIAKV